MLIEYLATKHRRDVSDPVGRRLVKSRIARHVYQTRDMRPESLGNDVQEGQPREGETEISQRTGKPKRRYQRRDMQAES